MKKKKKEQLKEIQSLKERLRDKLEAYLNENSRRTRDYTAYIELLQLLKSIDFDKREMEEVAFGPTVICPHVKLNTMRNISICLTIIYTHINCRVKPSLMAIPIELQLKLMKFERQLEKILFS